MLPLIPVVATGLLTGASIVAGMTAPYYIAEGVKYIGGVIDGLRKPAKKIKAKANAHAKKQR